MTAALLLACTLKVSIVVVLALVAVALLRRRSAAARHGLLASALAVALVLPVLGPIAPAWQAPAGQWLAGWGVGGWGLAGRGLAGQGLAGHGAARSVSVWDPSTWPVLASLWPSRGAAGGSQAPVALFGEDVPFGDGTFAARVAGAGAGAGEWLRALADVARRAGQSPLPLAIWLVGVTIALGLVASGLARLASLARRAHPVTRPDWLRARGELARAYGLRRPVTLLQSGHPTLILTWGLLRPIVLLPSGADQWPAEQVRLVLAHELAHVRRGDWAVQLVALSLRAIYWFNPLIWIACRRLRDESERASDDEVLRLGMDAPSYATLLMEAARAGGRRRQAWSPAPGMAHPSRLERRIGAMFDRDLDRRPVTRSASLITLAACVGLAVPLAGLGGPAPVAPAPVMSASIASAPAAVATPTPAAAPSQAGTATIAGTVQDPKGRAFTGTEVLVVNEKTGAVSRVVTDASGRFEVGALPAGQYSVGIREEAFRAFHATVTIAAGEQLERPITLALGEVLETIAVAPGSPAPTDEPRVGTPTPTPAADNTDPSQRVQVPLKLHSATPGYPDAQPGVGGRVIIRGQLATNGSVANLRVVESPGDAFSTAALDALKRWRYEPTRMWGEPVDTDIKVTIDFER